MKTDIATRNQQQVDAPKSTNWAEDYGAEGYQNNIVGTLLKFNKGEWLTGRDDDEIPAGTQLVAAIHLLQSGWIRWEDKKPAESVVGLRAEGFIPPTRETLGYTNKAEWGELNGQIMDPWQRTDFLLLADPTNGDIFTWSPASVGGLDAIKALAKEYGTHMREAPEEIPVVELSFETYKHADYGKIYKPVLEIVEWRDVGDVSFKPTEEDAETPQPAARKAGAQKPAPRKKNGKR